MTPIMQTARLPSIKVKRCCTWSLIVAMAIEKMKATTQGGTERSCVSISERKTRGQWNSYAESEELRGVPLYPKPLTIVGAKYA